jgi:hypothetical protein
VLKLSYCIHLNIARILAAILCKKSKYFDLCVAKVVFFFEMCKSLLKFLDRKTEEFSISPPYVRGKFCLSVFLSFSNMPVAGYLTLVNEWYFFTKKSSKNLEI